MPSNLTDYLMTTVEVISQAPLLEWGRQQEGVKPAPDAAAADLRTVMRPVYEHLAGTWLKTAVTAETAPAAGVTVSCAPPVVVTVGPADSRRWGDHMWPTVYGLRDGGILVRVIRGEDVMPQYQQHEYLHYYSDDHGRHWRHIPVADPTREQPATDIAYRFADGAELRYRDRMVDVDELAAEPYAVWGNTDFYRLGDLPADQCGIPMYTRRPQDSGWTVGTARFDPDMLLPALPVDVVTDTGVEKRQRLHIPEPYATRNEPYVAEMHVLGDGSLLTSYLNMRHMRLASEAPRGGRLPGNPASYLLRSRDRGCTWTVAGSIPLTGLGPFFRAVRAHVEPRFDGSWAALVRTSGADGSTHGGPLLLSRSVDQGRTWSDPVAIRPCSVNPTGLMLANGVAVRAYGRPGVFLTFCADGEGRFWGSDVTLVPPWRLNADENSCCNGNFLATGPDRFLYVYTRWDHRDPWGQTRVATLAQEVTVQRRESE